MSRIGDAPIQLPSNVTLTEQDNVFVAQGPLGQLFVQARPELKVTIEDGKVVVKRKKNDSFSRSLHGLIRSLLFNAVTGVEKGWEKRLELVGVGYRASLSGNELTLSVGYSHPVKITAPEGITFKVEENTKIAVSGIDKILVGQIAAKIRASRPPEPYQGKGIRYAGEYVRRKAGKAGKAGSK